MISVKDLQKSFAGARGEVRALRGVSFEVGKGELFTLLGPSGCGKTTTLRLIAGLEKPDAGHVSIGGEDTAEWSVAQRDVAEKERPSLKTNVTV